MITSLLGSEPLAHFHLLYHFGDVTRALTIRAIAMTLLLFIVVGLAVMALSTTSANYYLMAAGQCICGLGVGMGLPAMQSWGMERVLNQQADGGATLISTFQQLECLLGIGILGRPRNHGIQQHVREPLQKALHPSHLPLKRHMGRMLCKRRHYAPPQVVRMPMLF